jgi:hypothetical protein
LADLHPRQIDQVQQFDEISLTGHLTAWQRQIVAYLPNGKFWCNLASNSVKFPEQESLCPLPPPAHPKRLA